jgi:DNA polymerase III delta subunit
MGEIASPVLFIGDAFLTERSFLSYFEEIKSKKKGEIVLQTYHLSDMPLDKVLVEARILPFLCVAQVFRLKDAEILKEKHLEFFEHYLKDPTADSFLSFEAASLEKDHALIKLISKFGQVKAQESNIEKKASGGRFVREKLRQFGKTASPDALAYLEDQASEAPSFVDSLLGQLILYSGEKKEITQEMIEAFEENWKKVDVFRLTDAIAAQNSNQALSLLKQFLDENDKDLISLLGLLHWQIRRFWQARVLLDEGANESTLLRKCRISPKQAPYFMRQVRIFSRQKLEKALEGLFRLDWELKTGQVEGIIGLESWIVQLTGK